MSKLALVLYPFVLILLCVSSWPACVHAQTIEADIEVRTDATVQVRGKFVRTENIKSPRQISFERTAIGSEDLAARIKNLELFDASGKSLEFQKLMDGEYLANSAITAWTYDIDLSTPKNSSAAHASWISGDRGVLMGADLFPITARTGTLRFTTPNGWKKLEQGAQVSDISKLVVPVGNGWTDIAASDASIHLSISGTWNFTPQDAAEMIREVHKEYRTLFRNETGLSTVILSNFPTPAGHGNWQAETRGNTVTIISADMPFRYQSLQRLHEQLRHELFHLWIPNGVNLTGNYDWFYEGFALYESLKLAVVLNRIRFEDFLDTLSRAHTIDSAQLQRTSLIQASKDRFSGANTQVYARGMLVAFLCDLALLEQSKRKRSVEDILRDLFAKHRKPAEPVDGNTAVLALLRSNPAVITVVDKYVTGSEKLDWSAKLAGAGIEDIDPGPLTTLRVREKLNGRQKALLDKLGYNNWRKLSPTSK